MTEPEASVPPGPLADRPAAHAVALELLRRHATVAPRSRVARLLGRPPLTAATRSWYSGALGELAVGRLLRKLDSSWHVLHAVPLGPGDVDLDHLVIGPGGVFALNTRHHPTQRVLVAGRTVLVAGHRQDYVRAAEAQASRTAARLARRPATPAGRG